MSAGDDEALLARVLEHARHPQFSTEPADSVLVLNGGIADCGDRVTVWLRHADGGGWTVHAAVEGCSVSRGAGSLLLSGLQGCTTAELAGLDEAMMHELVGERIMLARPRCATLVLQVIRSAARRLAAAPSSDGARA